MIDMVSAALYVVAGLCLVVAIALWWIGRPERPERSGAAPGSGPAPGRAPAPAPAPAPWVARPSGPVPLPPPPPPQPPARSPAPAPAVLDQRAAEERRRLVELCIELSDRLADGNLALAGRVHRGLAEVGVEVVEPDGFLFDRREHDALHAEPAPSPEQVRTVASTARIGFVDRGEVLRRPGVVVYTSEGPS